ncbi:MAG: PAS domain S-box protein [Nibricoccus sp.]
MSTTDTERQGSMVLGQLLLMQNVLCNLPDEASIFSFICRGLGDMPGVMEVSHLTVANGSGNAELRHFPVQAGQTHWGDLIFKLSDPGLFEPYEAYLRNFIYMVGVILEERRQRRLNEEHTVRIEQAVEERTRQLKQANSALAGSEQKYRRLYETVLDGFGTIDMDGRIVDTNQVFLSMLGYSADEVRRLKYSDITPQRWHVFENQILTEQVLKRGYSDLYEKEYVRKDGTVFPIELRTYLIRDQQGQPSGMWAFMRDISERKQVEAEKNRLQEQLIQAQKMESVGRLAGGVAHDFNNMLQAIIGNASLALDETIGSDLHQECLNEIMKAARRSADLTQQLLAFARKQTVNPKVLDLNDTVASMLKMLQRLIGEDVQLNWIPGASLWPVWVDPVQIDQILANLTVNARDAIAGSGRITIETANFSLTGSALPFQAEARAGEYVLLKVTDTGCGIDEETRKHLFEPFYTTKAPGKGTGLGLATVYGIVRQNHGYINVRSAPREGSTFTIYLPRCLTPAALPDANEEDSIVGGTETILLVEDEAQILNLERKILELHGYKVIPANLPEEALERVARFPDPIHLVITDVVMPGMNGRELQTRVNALKPGARWLFVSGYTADVIAHQGVLDKSVQFLPKPFTIPDLARKVREVLDLPDRDRAS